MRHSKSAVESGGMELAELGRAAALVIAAQRWCALALSARDAGQPPLLGAMPFASVDGVLGIVASRLAAHFEGLLAGRSASVLLVDDAFARDAYALPRLSIAVTPRPAERGSPQSAEIWSALQKRHGATVALLETLGDFETIALKPESGRLILGFASAHDLDGATLADVLRRLSTPSE